MNKLILHLLNLRKLYWVKKATLLRNRQYYLWQEYERKVAKAVKTLERHQALYDGVELVFKRFGAIDTKEPDGVTMDEVIDMVAPPEPQKETFFKRLFKH